MRGGKHGIPAGDVLFVERERLSREQNDRNKDSTPRDVLFVDRIVKMARADGVFGQDQQAIARVPDGECPIPDEFGEAIGAPLFKAIPTITKSVESLVKERLKSLMSSALLSKRPSQVITAPDGETCGCVSRRDSFVVWKARYRIRIPPFEYDSSLSQGRTERARR